MLNKLINFFAPKTVTATDAVTFREDLLSAIVNKLRPQAFTDKIDGSYTLYVAETDDDLNYQAEVNKRDFKNQLLLSLENANITAVANAPWTIKTELPSENATGISEVIKGVHLQYVSNKEKATAVQPVHITAKVSIFHNRGSLIQGGLLDSAKQKVYNIGRFDEETLHENHIAINDPINSMSRKHAKIVFEEGKFWLHVLPSISRTMITQKDGSSREANLKSRDQLRDGDIIELGDAVSLKFEITDEDLPENKP
jgi:hypothetical protein